VGRKTVQLPVLLESLVGSRYCNVQTSDIRVVRIMGNEYWVLYTYSICNNYLVKHRIRRDRLAPSFAGGRMNKFYVYLYLNPGGEPFYVGKGHGNRAYCHTQLRELRRRDRFHNKLRGMLRRNIQPEIIILHKDLSERKAFEIEEIFIATYGRRDLDTGCLCNMTDGGEGGSGHRHSAETRQKISESHKGIRPSAGARRKMSEARKGKKLPQKTRQKMSIANKGKKLSKETRRKLSEVNKGKIFSVETRRKLSEGQVKIPVVAYDLVTGEDIKYFESQAVVRKDGFDPSAVRRVLKGKAASHKELGWKRATITSMSL